MEIWTSYVTGSGLETVGQDICNAPNIGVIVGDTVKPFEANPSLLPPKAFKVTVTGLVGTLSTL